MKAAETVLEKIKRKVLEERIIVEISDSDSEDIILVEEIAQNNNTKLSVKQKNCIDDAPKKPIPTIAAFSPLKNNR